MRWDSGGFAKADRYGPVSPGGTTSGGPAAISADGPAGTSTGATSAALPGSSGQRLTFGPKCWVTRLLALRSLSGVIVVHAQPIRGRQ